MAHKKLHISFFGSSLVSAYWNGAATYYRGIIKALHRLGHEVTFYEPDAYERQQHRDIADPDWANVVVYHPTETDVHRVLEDARSADILVKASGVGVFDELLEKSVLDMRQPGQGVIFWDVDAPATLDRVQKNPADAFRALIPQYDRILTYGGGEPVIEAYRDLGAQDCIPVYNAMDPETHHPEDRRPKFEADLAFLGNRLPDREARVEAFFLNVAAELPDKTFLLGGNGWHDKPVSGNVRYLGHVYTHEHNAFNCSPKAVLNISRDSMAQTGFSPATRVFEAAGAGACIISDAWKGIELFLEPGKEILVARSGAEVAEILNTLTDTEARQIGEAARRRVLSEHTYTHRAIQVEELLSALSGELSAISGEHDL
jgi:spore maturation protein CgeB